MDAQIVRGWRRFGVLAAVGWLGIGSAVAAPATGNPPLRISFLALERGEATLLQLPGGKVGLIGGGAAEDAPAILRILRGRGVKQLDFLVASTWAPEHVGGMPELLRQIPVRQLFHNPLYASGPAADQLFRVAQERARQRKLMVIAASMESTTVFFSPPCQIRHVGPLGGMYQKFANDPTCSLVVEVDYDHFSFLSLGDSRQRHQQALWKSADPAPSGELLQISHTGAKDALQTTFLKPWGTRMAIIPSPRKSRQLPDTGLLARLKQAGVRVFRTDQQGTITVSSDGRNLSVKTER